MSNFYPHRVLWHIDDSWAINIAVEGDAEQHWYFLHYKDGIKVEKEAVKKGADPLTMFPSVNWIKKQGYKVIEIVQKVGDMVILSDQYFHWCEVVGVSILFFSFCREIISPPLPLASFPFT